MKRNFSQLDNQHYDLLVCGGGIYGAWTAWDAALRGLKVALVEQNDWASGTSSASSKLVHGGLRYLETYDFRLVKKALTERTLLMQHAPHRVWPLRFGVPVYADSRRPGWQLKAGLMLYDWMAGALSSGLRHRHLTTAAFAHHFPALQSDMLRDGYTYTDAQTDDARLVVELVTGAVAAGAHCVNYCQLASVIERNGHACGAQLIDQLSGSRSEVSASQIVQASGQWLTTQWDVRDNCRLAKGVHLVLPALPQKEALLLTAPADGRVFFIIPWYGRTLLGTTDTDYRGDLDRVEVNEADIDYLLTAANHYLRTPWQRSDVIGHFAGVRVLQQGKAAAGSPSSLSRDWMLKTTANGVHHSIGGKLTSAREDAAQIVDAVCAALGKTLPCATRDHALPWAPEQPSPRWHYNLLQHIRHGGLDAESAHWLLRRYGERSRQVLALIARDAGLSRRIQPDLPLIHADLLFAAEHEMVVHLDDLLRRRMPLLILARLDETHLRELAERVAHIMNLDAARQQQEVTRCLKQLAA